MKIYTKTGDKGETSLYDGSRIQKSEQIFDLLGTIDELSAHIGSLLVVYKVDFLEQCQRLLIDMGSIIATPNPKEGTKLPVFIEKYVLDVEEHIDIMDKCLKPLTWFIIQTGENEAEARAHICRTITRKVEREMVRYGNVDEVMLKYINRLSDFFFTLARFVSE